MFQLLLKYFQICVVFCAIYSVLCLPLKASSLPINDSTDAPCFAIYEKSYGSSFPRLDAASKWLNRSNLWVEEFLGGDNWDHIEGWNDTSHTSTPLKYWANWLQVHSNSTLLLSVPPIPSVAGNTLAIGKDGTYNSHFQVLAQQLVNQGIANRVIIRFGWEFNCNWDYAWRVTTKTDAANFAAFWRQVVTTMRAVPGAENLKFCWNGVATIWTDYALADAYPDDSYVDYIGVDAYDQSYLYYPWSATASATQIATARANAWNQISGTLNNGIATWRNFAALHGKPFCIPEWGLVNHIDGGYQRGGLDNTYYVQQMYNFIHDSTNNVAFHCYFDVESNDGSHQISNAQGITTLFPNGSALFQSLFCLPYFTQNNDIGSVGITGTYSGLSNALTIAASGTGCQATATDSFRFSASTVVGDDTLLVHLTTLSSTTAQVGIMYRESMAANARYVAALVSNGQCYLQYRNSTGTTAIKSPASSAVTLPLWLKMVRQGANVLVFRSIDKMNWTYIGSQSVSYSTGFLGVAASSGSTATRSTAIVDNLDNTALPLTNVASISGAIVLDDATTSGVLRTGNWVESLTTSSVIGTGYRSDGNTLKGQSNVRYSPTIANSGYYDVYVSWTASYNRATNVPISVNGADGTTNLIASQQQDGSQWNYVGTYRFNSGTIGNVTISNTGTNFYTIADAVMFVPNLIPTEIIVDNTDSNNVALVGDWVSGSTLTGFYGTNYLYDSYQLNQSVTFTPAITISGNYEVFAIWTAHINRSTQTPIDVNYSGGSTTVLVNQQINGSIWNSLGTYPFLSGTTGKVVIRNTGANGFVVADAIRFVKK